MISNISNMIYQYHMICRDRTTISYQLYQRNSTIITKIISSLALTTVTSPPVVSPVASVFCSKQNPPSKRIAPGKRWAEAFPSRLGARWPHLDTPSHPRAETTSTRQRAGTRLVREHVLPRRLPRNSQLRPCNLDRRCRLVGPARLNLCGTSSYVNKSI